MPRFSLISICFGIAGFAGYFAIVAITIRSDSSVIAWLARSLGALYGTLIYFSGLSALYIACRTVRHATRPSELAVVIPLAMLPAFMGLVGLVHGYVGVYRILSVSRKRVASTSLFELHASVLACPLVGLVFSFVTVAIIAIAMVAKARIENTSDASTMNE